MGGRVGAYLRYHSDFDGEGLRIAAYVMERTGARPWRMATADYLAGVRSGVPGPAPGRVTDAPWDAELAPAIGAHGEAVTEEQVANTLLSDLADVLV